MKCPICGAEVKNPEHPKHISSKKHQDAILIEEFNLDDSEVFEEEFAGEVSYDQMGDEVPIGKIVSVDKDGINTIHIMDNGKEIPVVYNELRHCAWCGNDRLCSEEQSSNKCPVCDNLMNEIEYDQIIDMREKGVFMDTAVGERVPQEIKLSEGSPYESLLEFIDAALLAREHAFLKVPQIKMKIMENIVFEIIYQINQLTEEQLKVVKEKYFKLLKMN